jgi:hypothetical protein
MIVAPGAYDGITARMIARARFERVAKAPTERVREVTARCR